MNPVFKENKTFAELFDKIEIYSRNRVPILLYGLKGSKKEEFVNECLQELNENYSVIDCSLFYNRDLFMETWNKALESKTIYIKYLDRLPRESQLLMNRELGRLKENRELPWIVSSATPDLRNYIDKKIFTEELYYRLAVVSLELEPIYVRKKEILGMVDLFLGIYKKKYNKPRLKYMDNQLVDFFSKFNFPGDLEQLENLVEILVIVGKGRTLEYRNIPETIYSDSKIHSDFFLPIVPGISIKEYEKEIIKQNLKLQNGNREKTAEILDISVRTLYRKLDEYDLKEWES